MKEIINNKNNLRENDITNREVRIKALIINDGKIMIGNEENCYQFIGGHLEEGESHIDCLKREVLEEAGISLDNNEIRNCILKITDMNKDFPKEGINTKNDLYYYVVNTDKKPNIDKTNFTEYERAHNLSIIYLDLKDAIEKIRDNIPNNRKNVWIAPDMIEALAEFFKQKNINNEL